MKTTPFAWNGNSSEDLIEKGFSQTFAEQNWNLAETVRPIIKNDLL